MTDVAIIGNGPSREIYERYGEVAYYEHTIGCNFPAVDVEYSVFADAYAAKYLRKGAMHHDKYGDFKIVLGERAATNLKRIKHAPASTTSMLEWMSTGDYWGGLVKYPENFKDDQQYLSSGHIAFLYATTMWPECTVHMFGFDSLFTGDHLSTYSNRDVREWEDPYLAREVLTQPRDTALTWRDNWVQVFDMSNYKEVHFYGYENDPDLPFDTKDVQAVYIPRKA